MKTAKLVTMYTALLGAMLIVGYFAWQLERSWNYSRSYEDKVHGTVKEMVKPECLR